MGTEAGLTVSIMHTWEINVKKILNRLENEKAIIVLKLFHLNIYIII